jgi:excinuclease UvrABC ATPase subunit
MVFNIYIFPTETILQMLHHINFKLGDFTVCVKKKSQEENRFKSLFNIVNRLNTSTKVSEKEEEEMSEYKKEHCCFCFEGFLKHKCLFCTCITMILISLAVATTISMAVMALILMAYGNKQEEICQPMQMKISNRLLSNGEILEVVPPEKKL